MQINKNYPCRASNYRIQRRDGIKYIVIHYVGANGSAIDNVKYYSSANVGASAHYYVGHASENGNIYQSVAPENCAWHCGSETGKYYSDCRNDNSIGIEMCCHFDGQKWYFDDATVEKTIELTRWLMSEYGIDEDHVIRHYDVTHKCCPAPFVYDEQKWRKFKKALCEPGEYTDVDDIVWDLCYRGIVSDKEGLAEEMRQNPDGRLYWLARKALHYIRKRD